MDPPSDCEDSAQCQAGKASVPLLERSACTIAATSVHFSRFFVEYFLFSVQHFGVCVCVISPLFAASCSALDHTKTYTIRGGHVSFFFFFYILKGGVCRVVFNDS